MSRKLSLAWWPLHPGTHPVPTPTAQPESTRSSLHPCRRRAPSSPSSVRSHAFALLLLRSARRHCSSKPCNVARGGGWRVQGRVPSHGPCASGRPSVRPCRAVLHQAAEMPAAAGYSRREREPRRRRAGLRQGGQDPGEALGPVQACFSFWFCRSVCAMLCMYLCCHIVSSAI